MAKYKKNDARGVLAKSISSDTPAVSRSKFEEPAPHKDLFRELIELVVFIVVLVGLMQYFVAEAFVIPTGSMATTLLGKHKQATCPDCGEIYDVGLPGHDDGRGSDPVIAGTCPSCRYFQKNLGDISDSRGDMLLVAKYSYNLLSQQPSPLDIVVFKYPARPIYNVGKYSYIKRLIGMSGQTIAIDRGQIRVLDAKTTAQLVAPDGKSLFPVVDGQNAWRPQFMYRKIGNDAQAFMEKHGPQFQILRKPPAQMLAMRRLVYDNDRQSQTLEPGIRDRWLAKSGWSPDDSASPRTFRHAIGTSGESWLRYHHKLRSHARQLITDYMAYNSGLKNEFEQSKQAQNWVGDLMLECDVKVTDPAGFFVLELSKGVDRFQARWDLTRGTCTLTRLTAVRGKEQGRKELGSVPSTLKPNRTYRLRLANFDERLTVWVDNSLPFGDGVAYDSPPEPGPTMNDLEPASIGASEAGVQVSSIKLFRNTYYTLFPNESDSTAWDAVRKNRLKQDEVIREIRQTPGWEWVPMEELNQMHAERKLPQAVDGLVQTLRTLQVEHQTLWDEAHRKENHIFEEKHPGETEEEFNRRWAPLRNIQPMTLYVQPGHYLCLGDNSPASSDGREWGTVPERLLIGKAVLVYFPLGRFGRIK